jgi:diguanylate cyclase (GGDEF)-like protein/putative nucleotidyltransferase with HDIG domain
LVAAPPQSWRRITFGGKVFIGLVVLAGLFVLAATAAAPRSVNIAEFLCYLLTAMLASRFTVDLPEIADTMSVNFLFVLIGIIELSFAETLLLGTISVLVQCLYRSRFRPIRVAFNLCASAISITLAYAVYHQPRLHGPFHSQAWLIGLSATVYFVSDTGSIATAIALIERRSLRTLWASCYSWAVPYYVGGAVLGGLVALLNRNYPWETSLLVLPVVYLVYRSYKLYMSKVEDRRSHVEEMANLHLRTIEALALAIEAKDQTTHEHLERVQVYAIEVAKEMKLNGKEIDALHAAALLHDIGKLAVPEHIISKPGRLTPEEFEKMKIHPVVGAEILEHVRFPYPVVPIVRAHHEKWDGTGYPKGLKGEEIPMGARILSAVDFLDALASDRQYRRALPLDEVIKLMVQEAGKAFDPKVVDVLQKRYRDLERLITPSVKAADPKLSTEVKVERGDAPDAGFERNTRKEGQGETNFVAAIASARQEAQTLFELSQDLGGSLSIDETLSVFSVKLRRLVPYDAIAIYIRRGNELVPEHVSGDNHRLFSSLRIPIGDGLSGWVALNKKAIINGNPSVEPGYLNDPTKFSTLRSALAIPLDGLEDVVGVLALYKADPDAFTSDHLRVLQAISLKMGLAIENALKYQQAEDATDIDFLTGLPNARALFVQLDRELARCKREGSTLAVVVCDLDGFKQVNDRFGHLEGNRVLRLFAHAVKGTSREYDYIARMAADEFVIVAPGMTSEAAAKKAHQLRQLAKQSGQEVCGEEIVSISTGYAFFPKDGEDAETLLAEADRRMYLEKQKQPYRKTRRLYPRVKCRVTIELRSKKSDAITLGNLIDISLGGCFVETSAVPEIGSTLNMVFSMDDAKIEAEGTVMRLDPGNGIAVKFHDMRREERGKIHKVLDYVQSASSAHDKRYFEKLMLKK